MVFEVRSFIALAISCDIAAPDIFYLSLPSGYEVTRDLSAYENTTIIRLVIDLEDIRGIGYVTNYREHLLTLNCVNLKSK